MMNLCLKKKNFMLMAIAAILIATGFALVCGAPNSMSEFNADVFSFRRTVVGPGVSLLGYLWMIYAILAK